MIILLREAVRKLSNKEKREDEVLARIPLKFTLFIERVNEEENGSLISSGPRWSTPCPKQWPTLADWTWL